MKSILILVMICFFSLLILECACNKRMKPTPQRYKYQVNIDPVDYKNDKMYLSKVLDTMLSKNIKPFRPPTIYNRETTICIDTILYDPNKLRLAMLIINKLPNVLYDGYFLFCRRDSLNDPIKVYDTSSFGFVNFKTPDEVREVLYEYCFGRRATDHLWKNKEPRYNLDDIRFWSSREFIDITSDSSFIQLR